MISVIMPSYLGKYAGAAANREDKFLRAINSFLSQTHEDAELVIVADGCQRTVDLTPDHTRIQLHLIPKEKIWSPVVRNTGIYYAQGSVITYLDTDDMIGPRHLQTIVGHYDPSGNWGVFNDFIWHRKQWVEREVDHTKKFRCGTSNLVHKSGTFWPEHASDYEHDLTFIKSLRLLGEPQKLPTPDYRVCHLPRRYDV